MGVRKTRRLLRRREGGGKIGETPMTRNQLIKAMNNAKAKSNRKYLEKMQKELREKQADLMRKLKVQKNLEDMGVRNHQTNNNRHTKRRR
jgi:hypothetical protein